MRRLVAFAFLCLIHVAHADISTAPPANALSTVDQLRLYQNWFTHPYEYMFGAGVFRVGNLFYGSLNAGIGGIVKYGGIIDSAAAYLKLPHPSHGDLTPIERLAGMPIYKKPGKVNPAFVHWAVANAVPPPTATMLGHTCQEFYDNIFRRFFRLMAASRARFPDDAALARERDSYLKSARMPKFDGVAWLQREYHGALPEFAAPQDGTQLTPAMAIGFWLRRSSDGTEAELWTALRRMLTQYDPTFVAGLR